MKSLKEIGIESIISKTNSVKNILANIGDNIEYISCKIECDKLPEPERREKDGRFVAPMSADVFKIIIENKKPCLYFFEFNKNDREKIISSYEIFIDEQKKKLSSDRRVSPATKKKYPNDTSILYVGKSKGRNVGRLIVHLGYYDKGGTAGLQLIHWAKKLKIDITYHVFYFPLELRDFVDPLEISIARSLNPLLGKL